MRSLLTWVRGRHRSGASEVAVEKLETLGLIVNIHDVRGVGPDGVRVEARPAGSNGTAMSVIYSSRSARPVYVC